jgi:hypothetical protein
MFGGVVKGSYGGGKTLFFSAFVLRLVYIRVLGG